MDLFDSPIPNYDKPMSIIQSCVTLEQLIYAERYVELFKQRYGIGENDEFSELFKKYIFSKKMKLKNGWNNKS